MTIKRRVYGALFVGAAVVGGAAYAISGLAAPVKSSGSEVPPVSTAPVVDDTTPGGTFASQPALATPLSQAQAVTGARNAGAAAGATAAQSAAATSVVMTYSDFLSDVGTTSAIQLAGDNDVILVTVDATYPSAAIPSPPGIPAPSWSSYAMAFDPRTGLTLWVGPSPGATS